MAIEGNFGHKVHELKLAHNGDAPFGQSVSQAAHERNEARKAAKVESAEPLPPLTESPTEQTGDTVPTTDSSTITLNERPLTSSLQITLHNINEALASKSDTPSSIDTSIEASETDLSPEDIASNILSRVTSEALFSDYASKSELSGTELVDEFVGVITSGIQTGFDEAQLSLGEDESLSANLSSAHNLIMAGLEQFQTDRKTDNEITEQPSIEPTETDSTGEANNVLTSVVE